MTRLLLLPLLALAGCAAPEGSLPGVLLRRAEAPPPLPSAVLAALPPGVPHSVVTRNADGCYLVTVERTDPPTGFPLADAAGNRVCDAGAAPGAELAAAPAPAAAPPDPA